ncbi:hypothetical protein [Porphyromonas levii]|nr:hypothetical protein [Porphyromonas levii]
MKLNRTTLYYQPKGESEQNLEMMRIIDEYHTEHTPPLELCICVIC